MAAVRRNGVDQIACDSGGHSSHNSSGAGQAIFPAQGRCLLSEIHMRYDIDFLNGKELENYQEQILNVYREAFAPPPYNRNETNVVIFADAFSRHSKRAGFCFTAAVSTELRQIAGFAYGYTSAPGQWWHDAIAKTMPEELAAVWMEDAFEFAELAVAPEFQGQRIGSRLHDLLLGAIPHQRALLSTLQTETVALQLYRRRGWMTLLEDFLFPNVMQRYLVMGRKL